MYTLSGNPSTGHVTNCRTRGNDTMYVSAPPSSDVHPTGLCQDLPLSPPHVVPKWLFCHSYSTNLTTYPCLIPFHGRGSPSCHLPFVLRLSFLSQDTPGDAYNQLRFTQVCLQADSYKNVFYHREHLLHPYGFSAHDAAVICVKNDVVSARHSP